MGGYAPSHGSSGHAEAAKTPAATIGWILVASALCGAGLFLLLAFWIETFDWWAFSGAVLVLAGIVVFFRTWTGPESA